MFPFRDHNPSERTPIVTYALIAMNCIIFLGYWSELDNNTAIYAFYDAWAMTPRDISAGLKWETFITSAFLHGGIWHLLGNMLFLYIYGDNLEDQMGPAWFLIFYLTCAIAAGMVQWLSAPYSQIPVIGASGAVAGVMGGYLLLFPKAKVDVLFIFIIFFRIFSLPAWIILGIWIALQFLNGFSTPADEARVAYWAHIGGFVAGLLLCWPLFNRLGGRAYWQTHLGHPPHPDKVYTIAHSRVPKIKRRRS